MVNQRLAFDNPRKVEVEQLVPPRYRGIKPRRDRKRTPEQEAAESAAGFSALGSFFFGG